ncbi:MAG: hypothetical protein ACXABU_15515, partial [Candidatus Hodarchaeales archaeon]
DYCFFTVKFTFSSPNSVSTDFWANSEATKSKEREIANIVGIHKITSPSPSQIYIVYTLVYPFDI